MHIKPTIHSGESRSSRATGHLQPLACAAAVALAVVLLPLPAAAQVPPENKPPTAPSPVERLGPTTLRIGNVRVDTEKREISVSGKVIEIHNLEFVAVTKGGFKAYESALELDTNAIDFNVSLILIGLDPARSVPPKVHFDPEIPKGDPVEIWVEWEGPDGARKVRAEQLISDRRTGETLSEGPWVYTGSVFVDESKAYLADIEGSLIGFVHTPAPIIESPRPFPREMYGFIMLNPRLGLDRGDDIVLTVKALPLK